MKELWHPWWEWECYKAGFFDETPKKVTKERGQLLYREFLGDLKRFEKGLNRVLSEWKNSCEQNLTKRGNRIAWLGQASACIEMGVPACCRGGFRMLSNTKQREANLLALKFLNKWLSERGYDTTTEDQEIR
jgi:hypothetical protein